MKNKKGYYFSIDALIALIIVLSVVLIIKPIAPVYNPEIVVQEDLITVLSSIKIGELNNSYAKSLINGGEITNLNQSVLEQIGEFYATSSPEAENLADSILNDINISENVAIYFNNQLIAAKNSTQIGNASELWVSRQVISGIQQGSSATGFSARAFLKSSNKIDYYYLGGYIGDGNISSEIEGNVDDVFVEAAFSGDFEVYINDQFAGTHNPQINVPYNFNLTNQLDKFVNGTNELEFRGIDENLFIAGGIIKVIFNDDEILVSSTKKNFNGVEGIINIYDSIYSPGAIESMQVFIHYESPVNIYLNIGNNTVYSGNTSGLENSVTLTNAQLSSIIDYGTLEKETIPLKLGVVNISSLGGEGETVDVISAIDLSGSMNENVHLGNGSSAKLIDLVTNANKAFIDVILNYSQTRVGIVGYQKDASEENFHPLSNDSESLNDAVDSWSTGSGTCICCGINRAAQELAENSFENVSRSIIVMSDGEANVKCLEQGTGDASGDAILAACDAYDNYGIKVHSIGFGDGSDESTLQQIAACGHGNYYFSSIDQLVEIYKQIAEDILRISFVGQTASGENIFTKLYPDSYIKIDYEQSLPYGLIIKSETEEFGNEISKGNFFIPNDTIAYEVRVSSYSGSRWTNFLQIYNQSSDDWSEIYNLSKYSNEYLELGDPFFVNIPVTKINYGNNTIRISTGLSPGNYSGGSEYNKVFFSVVKNISSFSPIVSSAQGCVWDIEFEDVTTETIKVPSNYMGSNQCYYTSSVIAYNDNDAIDITIFKLLSDLDLNNNQKIETKFSENDLSISSSQISGIPFTWETEAQVRTWR